MKIPGTIRGGKVVLDEHFVLPEGTPVFVIIADSSANDRSAPVKFPLKKASKPGSVRLSNQRIAELLDDEDLSSRR